MEQGTRHELISRLLITCIADFDFEHNRTYTEVQLFSYLLSRVSFFFASLYFQGVRFTREELLAFALHMRSSCYYLAHYSEAERERLISYYRESGAFLDLDHAIWYADALRAEINSDKQWYEHTENWQGWAQVQEASDMQCFLSELSAKFSSPPSPARSGYYGMDSEPYPAPAATDYYEVADYPYSEEDLPPEAFEYTEDYDDYYPEAALPPEAFDYPEENRYLSPAPAQPTAPALASAYAPAQAPVSVQPPRPVPAAAPAPTPAQAPVPAQPTARAPAPASAPATAAATAPAPAPAPAHAASEQSEVSSKLSSNDDDEFPEIKREALPDPAFILSIYDDITRLDKPLFYAEGIETSTDVHGSDISCSECHKWRSNKSQERLSLTDELEAYARKMAEDFGPEDYLVHSCEHFIPNQTAIERYWVLAPFMTKKDLPEFKDQGWFSLYSYFSKDSFFPEEQALADLSKELALFSICQALYRKWYQLFNIDQASSDKEGIFLRKLHYLAHDKFKRELHQAYMWEFGSLEQVDAYFDKVIAQGERDIFKGRSLYSNDSSDNYFSMLLGFTPLTGSKFVDFADEFDYFSSCDSELACKRQSAVEKQQQINGKPRSEHEAQQEQQQQREILGYDVDSVLRVPANGYDQGLESIVLEPLRSYNEAPSPIVELMRFMCNFNAGATYLQSLDLKLVPVLQRTLKLLHYREHLLQKTWFRLYQRPLAVKLRRIIEGSMNTELYFKERRPFKRVLERLSTLTFAQSLAERGLSVDNEASKERFKLELLRAKENAAALFHYETSVKRYLGSLLGYRESDCFSVHFSKLRQFYQTTLKGEDVDVIGSVDWKFRRDHLHKIAFDDKSSLYERQLDSDIASHHLSNLLPFYLDDEVQRAISEGVATVWTTREKAVFKALDEQDLRSYLHINSVRVASHGERAHSQKWWNFSLSDFKLYLQDNFNEYPHENLLETPEIWAGISHEYTEMLYKLELLRCKLHFYELYLQFWKDMIFECRDHGITSGPSSRIFSSNHPLLQLVEPYAGTSLFRPALASPEQPPLSFIEAFRLALWTAVLPPTCAFIPIEKLTMPTELFLGCDNGWPMFSVRETQGFIFSITTDEGNRLIPWRFVQTPRKESELSASTYSSSGFFANPKFSYPSAVKDHLSSVPNEQRSAGINDTFVPLALQELLGSDLEQSSAQDPKQKATSASPNSSRRKKRRSKRDTSGADSAGTMSILDGLESLDPELSSKLREQPKPKSESAAPDKTESNGQSAKSKDEESKESGQEE